MYKRSLGHISQFDVISDTDTHVADLDNQNTSGGGTTYHSGFRVWTKIQAVDNGTLTEATFGSGNASEVGDAIPSGVQLQAGDSIEGLFTQINLTSGMVIAWRG